MQKRKAESLFITGAGVLSPIGIGRQAFAAGLTAGAQAFDVMRRPGRQRNSKFIGAELPELNLDGTFSRRVLQVASVTAKAALLAVAEAWADAGLDALDPARIGLVVGGSNLQRREAVNLQDAVRDQIEHIRPSHAFTFLDTDICGVCTEHFGIRGAAYTVANASASGLLAAIHAAHAVESGEVDAAIAIGALMDLSYMELHALRSIGAMGSSRYENSPNEACRPFDEQRDGFIFGESCAAVVIERELNGHGRPRPYARLSGWAVVSDANRTPNSSRDGVSAAIRNALKHANLSGGDIDYVNPHGTGSVMGDDTEIQALLDSGLGGAYINATKSLVGHGISSAGLVEVVASLVQMESGFLHPTRNLHNPIRSECNWVRASPVRHRVSKALCLSIGFAGTNCALCLERADY